MFDHLKKLDFSKDSTVWVDLPEVSPGARVCIKPATEVNKPYFNAMMKTTGARARRLARTERVTTEDVSLNRAEDRELYPRHVLVNWEGILDSESKPVPFSFDHAREFCAQIPDWLFDRLRNAASTPERFVSADDPLPPDGAELGKP